MKASIVQSRMGAVLRGPFVLALIFLLAAGPGMSALAQTVHLDPDLACQIQLEDARWQHHFWPEANTGSKPDRRVMLPDTLILDRVKEQRRRESVLAEHYGLTIDMPMLQAEFQRMLAHSRLPGRLDELLDALDRDPERISACLVRPVLIDRHYARLVEGYGGPVDNSPSLFIGGEETDPMNVQGKFQDEHRLLMETQTPQSEMLIDGWRVEDFPDGRRGHSMVWTGSVLIVWGGSSGGAVLDTGSRYDPVTDSWSGMTTVDAPSARIGQATVWTGSEMVVWGGQQSSAAQLDSGGRYDPIADRWMPISLDQAPTARSGSMAVWTGSEMLVWGGRNVFGGRSGGGRYDPVSDQWQAMNPHGEPAPRYDHALVWTGGEMLVWGGRASGTEGLGDGARYNPQADAWEAINPEGAPSRRFGHSAVWTGVEMIVWGGQDLSAVTNTGGRYDPVTNSWTATAVDQAAAARIGHAAVWTGTEMLVWGGGWPLHNLPGGRYDPIENRWQAMNSVGAPPGSEDLGIAWTGSEMLVWGGVRGSGGQVLNSGGRYAPAMDAWQPINDNQAPLARNNHVAVWTGTHKLIWGGDANRGSRYDPVTDHWSPMSVAGAPDARIRQTAVWTGTEMIIWGGVAFSTVRQTGARYNPTTDTWNATSLNDAPAARMWHSAVWSGKHMLIWGGEAGGQYLADGAAYDPITDGWQPLVNEGAPEGRAVHSAFWTGTEMLIWGGRRSLSDRLNSGALYDPISARWHPMTLEAAPVGRYNHSAVWTGEELIVWGGNTPTLADGRSGGRYSLAEDHWRATSSEGAPSRRPRGQATVWTGQEMIVWSGWSALITPTGGRYDPVSDQWTDTTLRGVPAQRDGAIAAWTGEGMLIWGGHTNTVGVYYPEMPAPALQLRIVSVSPAPVRVGETVRVVAEMFDEFAPAPTDGQLEIRADTGESCFDPGPPVHDGGLSLFSCELSFDSPGVRRLAANFRGSTEYGDLDTLGSGWPLEVLSGGLYRLGGQVSRLFGSGLTLRNNLGEVLALDTDGSFRFTEWLPDGASYSVDILAQPLAPNQVCTLSPYAGRISGADVIDLLVMCEADLYRVSGSVLGLAGSGLELTLNNADPLQISEDGDFGFRTGLAEGTPYQVSVSEQPRQPAQTCTVENGEGVIARADIEDVRINCVTDLFRVDGSVSGLEGSGLVLRNNAGDDRVITGNGSFFFETRLPEGSLYEVSVASQPAGPAQTCTLTAGSGVVGIEDVRDISVECVTDEFRVEILATEGGTVQPEGVVLVAAGAALMIELTVEDGHVLEAVGGTCGGALESEFFTTEPVLADCTVEVSFVPVDTRSLRFVRTPAVGVAGLAVRPRVEVEIRTATGERDTSDHGTLIVLSLEGGHPDAVLSGSIAVETSAGLAVFRDLLIDRAGSGYQLLASDEQGRLNPAISGSFRVVPDR